MSIKPEGMTLEQIKEQLALYNRLYYSKRRVEKDFMETKRASAIRYNRRKKLDKIAENGDINLKYIDYENKPEDLQNTTPRKYKAQTYKIITVE